MKITSRRFFTHLQAPKIEEQVEFKVSEMPTADDCENSSPLDTAKKELEKSQFD